MPRSKEESREYMRRWIKKHRKEERERSRQNRKDNPEYGRKYSLKRRYGLSHEDWLKIWENQDGKCAICGEEFTKPSNAFVDHNHDTGEIRGLLCVKCNFGIGYFNNNPKIMIKAIKYLKY